MRRIIATLQKIAQEHGIKEVAAIIGTKAENLRKKLNPNDESHQITLAEFVHVFNVTGKPDALLALNAELGYAAFKIPKDEPKTIQQICLMDILLKLNIAEGTACSEIKKSLEDGVITVGELVDIERAVYEMHSLLATVCADIRSCVQLPQQTKVAHEQKAARR